MTASKFFLYFCLFFIGGIFLSSFFVFSVAKLQLLLIFLIFLALLSFKNEKLRIIVFSLLFLISGIWRFQQAELKIKENPIQDFIEKNDKVLIEGIVSDEPETGEKSTQLTIKVQKIIYPKEKEISGAKILALLEKYSDYQYGDKIKIEGFLKSPPQFEDFNYKNYLLKDGIFAVIYWPEIEILQKNQGNFLYSQILSLKEKLRKSVYQNLSPPQSTILIGIILGDKGQMSQEWKENLNITGLSHITAISGMNITILASILTVLAISLGFSRSQAFYFILVFLIIFLFLIGLQPSAVRAAIMAILFLLAQKMGRLASSLRTIVFAAALMLFQNPFLLKLDVGFQLSFLAILGIIYLTEPLQDFLKFLPEFKIFPLKPIVAMTLAAQIFTLPILLYNFGTFSKISLLTNILVLPVVSYIMIFGFLLIVIGIISQSLAWIFSFPCYFLLTYLTKTIEFFAKPWAANQIKISWPWLFISYLIIAFVVWRLENRQKLNFLN